MYRFRIYPSQKQKIRLINSFKTCKAIYNELLDMSVKAYKESKKTLRKFDYDKHLTRKYLEIYAQVKQNVSDRLHKAMQNFFRRVKDPTCKEKGFPRFKSRVQSITYPQATSRGKRNSFWFISNKRLHASKIGNIPIVLHRVPKGKIKTLTIKQNRAKQWFAFFACEIDNPIVEHPSSERVGIDVGLENFATLSNGETVANPKFLVKAEKRIKMLNRRLSRKKKGSRNRGKARFLLARTYNKVSNQRTDFLHKLSHKLTTRFGSIAVEDLQISNMVRNHHLAKSIGDASWSSFISMLSYKAIIGGGQLTKVSPRNTSKTCSNCGTIREIPLNERTFTCAACDFACQRDLNASLNILKVGTDCAELNACGHNVRPSLVKAVVDEAETITTKPSTSSVVESPTS
ncbi:MAG: IS200/IS605 family element transposase accessory protein TnpB [Candidatus Blackburnbacteria bacterium]|nr:IS200/IS605 family element transposase accessory protein TnpB [Candidatus Blackburnbacteria bacterium]